MLKISVILPVYNEEKIVKNFLKELHAEMEKHDIEYEIIAVDDGSQDNTGKEIEESGINVEILSHEENIGYGAAIKTGIEHARYEKILIIDADGSYSAASIGDVLNNCHNFDMVVGARTGSKVKTNLLRAPAKWFLTRFAEYLANKKIPDLNSGLRIFRKDLANKFLNILPDGFSFTTTITLAMLVNRYKVKYVSIDYLKRVGRSKIRPLKDTMNFIVLIIGCILYFKPLRVFIPVSVFLFIISLSMFLYDIIIIKNIGDKSVMSALVFLQIFILGMLADLIVKKLS